MPAVQAHVVDAKSAKHGTRTAQVLTNSRHTHNEGPDAPTVAVILPDPADSGT